MTKELFIGFNCPFGGCSFFGEYKEKDIVNHFKEEHPVMKTIKIGNKEINIDSYIPEEEVKTIPPIHYMTLEKFIEKIKQVIAKEPRVKDTELDIAVSYLDTGDIIVLPPDILQNSMEQQNRVKFKL